MDDFGWAGGEWASWLVAAAGDFVLLAGGELMGQELSGAAGVVGARARVVTSHGGALTT